MKYFIDTEFAEKPCTIQLISIGIVAEDGREYYAESSEIKPEDCNEWVRNNVLNRLNVPEDQRKTRKIIAQEILEFIGDDDKVEFWGFYSSYDWVVFCWLFGAMVDLPKNMPKFCRDLKQEVMNKGNPKIPFGPEDKHNALSDARWMRKAHKWLRNLP
jgi:hypothetical protein